MTDSFKSTAATNIYDQAVNTYFNPVSVLPETGIMGISFWQIAIVVVLVVLLFGRGKISSLMGDVAKGIKSFKKGMSDDTSVNNQDDNSKSDNSDSENK